MVHRRIGVVVAVLSTISALLLSAWVPAQANDRDPRWRTGGDSRACSAPSWPEPISSQGPGNGERVLVVGDSLTRESRDMLRNSLRASGWNPTIRCFGGKRLDWGMSQLRDQKRWKGLPSTVVIALGTNDMRWIARNVTKQRIIELLDMIGQKRNVLWINTYGGNGDRFSKEKQRWFNTTLDRLAAKRANVRVLQWGKIASKSQVRLSSAIHYTYPGYRLRTEQTVLALNSNFGTPMVSASTPLQEPVAIFDATRRDLIAECSCIHLVHPLDSHP